MLAKVLKEAPNPGALFVFCCPIHGGDFLQIVLERQISIVSIMLAHGACQLLSVAG